MPLLDRFQHIAQRGIAAGRAAAAAFSITPPAVPGTKGVATPYRLPRDRQQQAILDSREAMYGRATYYAGPVPSYITTNPAANLSPGKIASIHSEVLTAGYMVNKACLDEQIWLNDAHLRAVDTARRVASVGKPFSVEPCEYPDRDLAQWVADYVAAAVGDIDHFDRSMKQLLFANAAGYALQEVVWQDKTIHFPVGRNKSAQISGPHPQQLDWVHNKHTRFDVDTDRILLDMGNGAFVELPTHKFVVHELSEDFQKRRRGYMYPVVWLHMIKQQAIMRWSNVLDIWGIPVPHGKVDYALWQDETRKEEYRAMLRDAGLGIPFLTTDDFNIEKAFEITTGDARGMHAAIIGFVDQTISKVVQGETLTTELGGVGSYNASETHAAVKESIVAMDALDLAGTVRATLFKSIIQMNVQALASALGRSPAEILRCIPWPYWRIEREVTPQVRMEIIKSAVNDLGMKVDAPAIYREMGLPKARDLSRALKGEPITVADGAQVVGSVAGAEGLDNPKDPTSTQTGTGEAKTADGKPASVDLTPSAQGAIIKVDEARAVLGLPPLGTADGSLTINEFIAKHDAVTAEAAAATDGQAGPAPETPTPAPRAEEQR